METPELDIEGGEGTSSGDKGGVRTSKHAFHEGIFCYTCDIFVHRDDFPGCHE